MNKNRASRDRRNVKRPGSWDRRGGKKIRAPRPPKAVALTRHARKIWKEGEREDTTQA